jgi:hypothetical protein
MNSGNASLEIGGLADLDLPTLRQHWQELYASEPPLRMSRELMVQAIAYRIQERTFGGLSRAARLKLADAAGSTESATVRSSRRDAQHRVKPGTRFLREWQGETYEVTATADGRFFYRIAPTGRSARLPAALPAHAGPARPSSA